MSTKYGSSRSPFRSAPSITQHSTCCPVPLFTFRTADVTLFPRPPSTEHTSWYLFAEPPGPPPLQDCRLVQVYIRTPPAWVSQAGSVPPWAGPFPLQTRLQADASCSTRVRISLDLEDRDGPTTGASTRKVHRTRQKTPSERDAVVPWRLDRLIFGLLPTHGWSCPHALRRMSCPSPCHEHRGSATPRTRRLIAPYDTCPARLPVTKIGAPLLRVLVVSSHPKKHLTGPVERIRPYIPKDRISTSYLSSPPLTPHTPSSLPLPPSEVNTHPHGSSKKS